MTMITIDKFTISIMLLVMFICGNIFYYLNTRNKLCPYIKRCIVKSDKLNKCLINKRCINPRHSDCYIYKYLKILEQFGLEENKINEMINDIIKKNIGEIN